ncbi:MAG: hypothetical protein H6668_19040 [Ardenticatenaceae bacterium]|nr:hypothetical protein [Ardenticatenaceae bacterium]
MALIRQHDLDKATSKKVKLIWDDLADELLALPFVRDQDTWLPLDKVDFLQLTLRFAAGMTFSTAADAVLFIRDKVWGVTPPLPSERWRKRRLKARRRSTLSTATRTIQRWCRFTPPCVTTTSLTRFTSTPAPGIRSTQ